jgi:hypothetical protein
MTAVRISKITTAKENALKTCISPFNYSVEKQNTATATVVIRAPNAERGEVKRTIEKKLKDKNYYFTSSRKGSIGVTNIVVDDYNVSILYKPLSGGMSETTLNSTITELAPALAFMAKKKTFSGAGKFYEFIESTLTKGNASGCYLNSADQDAGHQFIRDMPSSSKFKIKMENAMAILDYLWDLDKESSIEQVYFAYRAKPQGIRTDHKGDLFVKFKTGKFLGVSLKAGGANTAEPQLNTYVNKIFDDMQEMSGKNKLILGVQKHVHSKLGLSKDWRERQNKDGALSIIESFRENNPDDYEKLYDKQLELCRDALINLINANKKDTAKFITQKIIKKDENVPLVVIKAFGKSYKQVTDEDAIEIMIPKTKTIRARKSNTSKQDWFIDLQGTGRQKLTMKMSIRTNQPPPNNKIAQGFNLAVKFNGIVVT